MDPGADDQVGRRSAGDAGRSDPGGIPSEQTQDPGARSAGSEATGSSDTQERLSFDLRGVFVFDHEDLGAGSTQEI